MVWAGRGLLSRSELQAGFERSHSCGTVPGEAWEPQGLSGASSLMGMPLGDVAVRRHVPVCLTLFYLQIMRFVTIDCVTPTLFLIKRNTATVNVPMECIFRLGPVTFVCF